MSTVTVTGKTGAGLTMTAQTFNDVSEWAVVTETEVLRISQPGKPDTFVDISAATTFTVVITAPNTYTVTVS